MKHRNATKLNSLKVHRGMTLVEVLLALTILSLALMFFLDVLSQGNTISRKSDYEQIATQAGMDMLTKLQQTPYESLLTDSTTTTAVSQIPGGQMTTVVRPLDGNSSNTNIREIDVTVTWTGASAQAQVGGSITLTGLVSAGK